MPRHNAIHAFERAQCTLQLTYAEVARAIAANEARDWLARPLPYLEGRTPHSVLAEGRPDLLLGILLAQGASAPPFERQEPR